MTDVSMPIADQQSDDDLIRVLCSSLYPGAKRDSAALVLSYCRAISIDPMLKPVHIMPMRCKTGEKDNYGNDKYEMRDTIMPGIGLYRIQAARTGQYAGKDEPQFGPVKVMNFNRLKVEWVAVQGRDKKVKKEEWIEDSIEYPEWCAVTVYRIIQGVRCAWTAVEYWVENYATSGRDSDAPNEMWARRTRGQLAKCTEAQALRQGFPEVGTAPTAEEMEGRSFDIEGLSPVVEATSVPTMPRRASEAVALPEPSDPDVLPAMVVERQREPEVALMPVGATAQAEQATPVQRQSQPDAAPDLSGEPASAGECMNVIKTAAAKKLNLPALLEEFGLALDPATLSGLTKPQFKALKGAMA